jgi:hypothetical protein
MADTYTPSYSGGGNQENHSSRLVQSKNVRDPIWKITKAEKDWRSIQVVEHLPNKGETW